MSWTFTNEDGSRIEAVDEDRKVYEYAADGTLLREWDYTPEENAALDAVLAIQQAEENARVLREGLQNVIDTALERQADMDTVIGTPNAEINSRPAPYIVRVARATKRQDRAIIRLARLAGNILDTTNTGTD